MKPYVNVQIASPLLRGMYSYSSRVLIQENWGGKAFYDKVNTFFIIVLWLFALENHDTHLCKAGMHHNFLCQKLVKKK